MNQLYWAALGWVLLHLLVAGPLRPGLLSRMGLGAFRGMFGLLSMVSLGWLVGAYRVAPKVAVFPGVAWVPLVLMPVASILLVCSLSRRNPTMIAGQMFLQGALPVEGITRVTRHPMLWAFSLWGLSHALACGHLSALVLTGAIVVTALNGMISIDRKMARAQGEVWEAFAAATSRLPFGAIAEGRQKWVFSEIGWGRIALGLGLFFGLAYFHQYLTGWPVGILGR